MSDNMKIFQIYYKDEQKPNLDPAFTPWDNKNNPRPDLQEWYIWDQMYQQCCEQGLDHWGFVSWKFKDKSNLSGEQFVNWINANPGHDVYFVNPAILNEAVFANGWEQGDVHHPNLSAMGNRFLQATGYDVEAQNVLLDRTKIMWANYWVGSRKFWDGYMAFTRKLFDVMEQDVWLKEQIMTDGLSNYNLNKNLPNFPFVIERLISTYIDLENIDAVNFEYSIDTAHEKYRQYFGDIAALSNLKLLINRYDSDDLYNIWDFYRNSFLAKNPGIIHIE